MPTPAGQAKVDRNVEMASASSSDNYIDRLPPLFQAPTRLPQTHVASRAENLCRGCGKIPQRCRQRCSNCAVKSCDRAPCECCPAWGRQPRKIPSLWPSKQTLHVGIQGHAPHGTNPANQHGSPPELFSQKIQPLLSNVATSVIRSCIEEYSLVGELHSRRLPPASEALASVGGTGKLL
jgi:hypothetical protein